MRIGLEGAANFRDLGGHPTASGRSVRRGLLFRSQALDYITPNDRRVLDQLGIRVVWDLRSRSEREQSRAPWVEASGVEVLPLNVNADLRAEDPTLVNLLRDDPTERGALRMMVRTYRCFPQAFARHLRVFFDRLLAGNGLPAIIHCTAGKDRTGFLSAMLLFALDVPKEVVLEDYMATGRYMDFRQLGSGVDVLLTRMLGSSPDPSILNPILETRVEYVEAALESIAERYGSVDGYLETVAGLDGARRQRLHELMLE